MSLFPPYAINAPARESLQADYTAWLGGSDGGALLTERTGNLNNLKIAAAKKPDPTAKARTLSVFTNALYRDAVSGFATRGQILANGARGRLVELHVGALLGSLYTPNV